MIRPHSAEQLASRLGRQVNALQSSYLNALREQQGWLQYTHPEVVNHPQQAYVVTDAGRAWLANIGFAEGWDFDQRRQQASG